jgi:hypothetical protein
MFAAGNVVIGAVLLAYAVKNRTHETETSRRRSEIFKALFKLAYSQR